MPGVKGRSGRKPKSTEQHAKDGTLNVTRHAGRADVLLPKLEDLPKPPATLGEDGRELWQRLAKLFKGKLTEATLEGLESYCDAWEIYRKLTVLMKADPKDKETRIAWKAAADLVDRHGRQWGWSPLAAASIKLAPPKDGGKSAFDSFLEQRGIGKG